MFDEPRCWVLVAWSMCRNSWLDVFTLSILGYNPLGYVYAPAPPHFHVFSISKLLFKTKWHVVSGLSSPELFSALAFGSEPETVGSFGDSYIQLLFALMNRWLAKTQTFSVLTICDVNLSSHACDNSMIVGLICIYITFHLLLGKKSLVHGQMRHQVFPSTEIPQWPGKIFRYALLSIIITKFL